MINHMGRQLTGFRERYDQLSEFAYPNWSGVFGLFAVTDHATYTTQFGRGLRRTPFAAKEQAAIALNAFLELFEHAYNSIAETLPEFIAELEPLFGPDEENESSSG
jgi:hypothetical protein